jgi:hypothetical protein
MPTFMVSSAAAARPARHNNPVINNKKIFFNIFPPCV